MEHTTIARRVQALIARAGHLSTPPHEAAAAEPREELGGGACGTSGALRLWSRAVCSYTAVMRPRKRSRSAGVPLRRCARVDARGLTKAELRRVLEAVLGHDPGEDLVDALVIGDVDQVRAIADDRNPSPGPS